MIAEREKEICQCRKCNNVFHQSEALETQSELFGYIVNKKVCPRCGGNYGLMKYIEKNSIEGVYKTNKFFTL